MTPYYDDGICQIWHGDCREVDAWDAAGAFMVTDPPYGINHSCGWAGPLMNVRIAGDASTAVRDEILARWAGPALVFGTWRVQRPDTVRAVLVWDKGSWGMGDLSLPWTPSWEEIYVIGSGFVGRRDNGVLRFNAPQTPTGREHPNQKPVALMQSLIMKCAPLADIVDPFMGSGTTLRAAKDLGRRAVGVEIDERYCEVAARRLGQEVLAL